MTKRSKSSYSTGTISINGKPKASTYKKGNNVITNYNMTEAEKKAFDYAQNSFAENLPSINVFDKDTQNSLQSELDTYTLNGQKIINNTYTPLLNNLKTDIASRFGNFDNSVFMDNLNSIEANRAQSINDLAQDVMAKRSELINNELSQRYDYLSFLQDIQNRTYSNILNFANVSQQNSASGTAYNAQNTDNSIGYSRLISGLLNSLSSFNNL